MTEPFYSAFFTWLSCGTNLVHCCPYVTFFPIRYEPVNVVLYLIRIFQKEAATVYAMKSLTDNYPFKSGVAFHVWWDWKAQAFIRSFHSLTKTN